MFAHRYIVEHLFFARTGQFNIDFAYDQEKDDDTKNDQENRNRV